MSTLVVGLDAACQRVLDPLFEAGAVPALRDLFETGASGPLESQVPPWTASAWPSLYTGTNPGKHGVFDFLAFDGYDWSVVDANHVRTPSLWELLDHHGLASVVVNVPVTHPPPAVDGAVVPGYAAPEDPDCHPAGLLDDVRDAVGEYRVYPAHTGERDPARDEVVEEHVALAGQRGRAFRYLADRFDPDFGFLQFQGTDSVVHELPGDREALREVYAAVDREVAATLDEHDPDNVVVVSDHGIGPYRGHDVRVNEVLRDAGHVSAVRGGEGMPTWATVRDDKLAAGEADTRPSRGLLARATAALARAGVTSQRVESALEPLGLADTVKRLVPTDAISAATEQVDFPNSAAYVRSRTECGVRLNVRGREPDGVVSPDDYEATRRAVVELLSRLKTPAGDPVFETVAPREEFFHGPAADRAVDVVTVPADFEHFLSARLAGDVFGAPTEPWNHKRHGVFAARGAAVDPDGSLDGAHLFDVAPTVLATLGVPAAERMDGRTLPVVDAAGTRSYPDAVRREATDDAGDAVESRLADLGYLERT